MERALTLAEPEGYVRLFVDEGEPMRLLIRLRPEYSARLRIENARASDEGQTIDRVYRHDFWQPSQPAAVAAIRNPKSANPK